MIDGADDLTLRRFLAGLAIVFVLAAALRVVFPTADPPWNPSVGITWHDEGPWVHNARNRALWGQWSTDRWNPMYLAPVFTGLEYASFESFGVGLWQARLVSAGMGLASILVVAFGVAACANRRTALVAATLLATSHEWVQWNRVALLETTMVAFIAIAWGAYAIAGRRPWYGALAGLAAVLAFFSKAAAAFFVAALGLEALLTVWLGVSRQPCRPAHGRRRCRRRRSDLDARRPAGLGRPVPGVLRVAQLGRVPLLQLADVGDAQAGLRDRRVRRPRVLVAGRQRVLHADVAGDAARADGRASGCSRDGGWRGPPSGCSACRWRSASPSSSSTTSATSAGSSSSFPLLVVQAALVLGTGGPVVSADARRRASTAGRSSPLPWCSMRPTSRAARSPGWRLRRRSGRACGSRRPGRCSSPRRSTRAGRARRRGWPSAGGRPAAAAVVLLVLVAGGPRAVRPVGRRRGPTRTSRPRGSSASGCRRARSSTASSPTGSSLENRIRPIFVGRGFGNYDDRNDRDDVRYILTYVAPRLGYEGRGHPGRARRRTRIAYHHDVRRGRNGHRPRPRRPHRQAPHCVAATRPGVRVRRIDERAIKAHADLRFRSEYDYALFEYYRSAKVIAFLERRRRAACAAACSTPAAAAAACRSRFAEEADAVVGIDPACRASGRGRRGSARERGVRQPALRSGRRHGAAVPRPASFDLVLSHAVIEHVADAPLYLRECARVLRARRPRCTCRRRRTCRLPARTCRG